MLKITDLGGAIIVHTFACIFGLAVARCLYKPPRKNHKLETSNYVSDTFALIGTVFLWCYWPSFNAGPGDDSERYMAIINTYLSLCGSAVSVYFTSIAVSPERKLTMAHVQNATLAGGVAMAATASMPVHPFGALLIGSIAGIASVLGFKYTQVMFFIRFKVQNRIQAIFCGQIQSP